MELSWSMRATDLRFSLILILLVEADGGEGAESGASGLADPNLLKSTATQITNSESSKIPSAWPRLAADLPEPPRQHHHWKVPATKLQTNLVSSVQVLFDLGLADPRGCDYREFEAVNVSLWGEAGKIKAHGWVIPSRPGATERFAVSWVGTVLPVTSVGAKADLKLDVDVLLRTDEELRNKAATVEERSMLTLFLRTWPQTASISESNMMALKVALLFRSGETRLAESYWAAWRAPENGRSFGADDPFLTLGTEWSWAVFDRAICAHMR